jgi:type II secretory ATPase GspE/PulE/Tfp pilus assembly ATPase PilB-like protein
MDMQINGLARALASTEILTTDQAYRYQQQALAHQQRLAEYLYAHQLLDMKLISQACDHYFGMPTISLNQIDKPSIDNGLVYFKNKNQTSIAILDPSDLAHIHAPYPVYLIQTKDYYTLQQQLQQQTTALPNTSQQLFTLIKAALQQSASDIHIEPTAQHYRVRLRIHGQLQLHERLDQLAGQRLITQLIVHAQLDITQTQLAQDGRFAFENKQQQCDCRLNICPTLFGLKAVIRLLNTQSHALKLEQLGLLPEQLTYIKSTLKQTQGLVLVTGPTGSGKTQTLYSMLQYLSQRNINISTIEDPIEIKLAGINQIPMRSEQGFTSSHILRALLRQDPDVIMIGEIRDTETATLALRAAQTGHLVLATVHAQNSLATIQRLVHLGISTADIAACLRLVISQRLVRSTQTDKPRIALFETLAINAKLAQAIEENQSTQYLLETAQLHHYIRLQDHLKILKKQQFITKDTLESIITHA